jgi:hypothetical protein
MAAKKVAKAVSGILNAIFHHFKTLSVLLMKILSRPIYSLTHADKILFYMPQKAPSERYLPYFNLCNYDRFATC